MSENLYSQSTYKTSSSYIIPADFPDLDVIRVDDTYYMVSTTMHFMSGCVILRSHNLVDWEHAAYVYDELEASDGETLRDNRGVYGSGMWAACLRHHKGKFYVSFVANDLHKTFLFTADKIEGPWKKSEIEGFYHDMSILFDDDGRVYCVSGNMNITLTELESDLSAPKKNGVQKVIIRDNPEEVALGYEGSHIYKINGKYYVFLIHILKGKMRSEACFVSDKIDGEYSGGDVLCSDLAHWNSGTAQGGIVQAPDGEWFSVVFQDHGALGRIPVLVPVKFVDDFPVFSNGVAPESVTVQDLRPDYVYKPLYSDDFTAPAWQWNHIPNKSLIELERARFCVKTDKTCINITQAANTLTQRTFTEDCAGSVTLSASEICDGDIAGLGALEGEYGFIGVKNEGGKYFLIAAEHKNDYSPWTRGIPDTFFPKIIAEKEISATEAKSIKLRLVFSLHYPAQSVQCEYFDEKAQDFVKFGKPISLRYTLDQFVGVRFALFCYSTKQAGAKATFTNFKLELL